MIDMESEILRRVQLVQLEILLEFDRVCKCLGVNYFLDSGTLLGAVRHNGFIPWDDDIDVGMLRNDYDVFMERAGAYLDTKYYLQNWDTDDKYGLAFAKLRKNKTIYVEDAAKNSGAHCGIYIDIFPYDDFPLDEKKQKWQKKRYFFYRRLLLIKNHYSPWKMGERHPVLKRIAYIPFRIISLFFRRETIKKKYISFSTRFNGDASNCYYPQAGASDYGKWLVPRECLSSFEMISFEGFSFKCPSNNDLYLRSIYGNYMELPPVEKRINRHKIIKIDFGDE